MSRTARLTSDLIARPQACGALPCDADCGTSGPHRHHRRSLVLTDESARHPFRATLPPHVRADLHEIPAESLWRLTTEDVRGFASVYFAATAATFAFIV
jgi:hypothetical protein